ncbi:MAG: hypothetical protein ACI3T9_07340 [Romboutsia timonensis]
MEKQMLLKALTKDMVNLEGYGNTVTLVADKRYQKVTLQDGMTIALPTGNNAFNELHLFFKGVDGITVTFPTVKWQGGVEPTIEADKIYELIFTYIFDEYIGGFIVYE